ncbi:hypothetical protein ABT224_09050 [Streptomyces sp. NPDC001584]|uniref:hypothetical protein n=1 Tax=Streptomyces sp. NPDC001584 TaxID=3154521 RepID=UPI00332FA232
MVLPGVVTRLTETTVARLGEPDARADGFRDLTELHGRLRHHYPDIGPADRITVVHFRPVR